MKCTTKMKLMAIILNFRRRATGDFYLQTNGELPFSRGLAGINYVKASTRVASAEKGREDADANGNAVDAKESK